MIISKQAHVISLHLSWSSESFISLITSLILHLFTLISVFPPLVRLGVLWLVKETHYWLSPAPLSLLIQRWSGYGAGLTAALSNKPAAAAKLLLLLCGNLCEFLSSWLLTTYNVSVLCLFNFVRLFQILQKSESASKNDTPVISLSLLHWAAQSCDLSPISNFGAMCSASFEPDAVTKNHCWSSWCS